MGTPSSSRADSGYRTASAPPPAPSPAEDGDGGYEEALHPVLAIVWLASLVRVVGALWLHETLGAEATLALMTLVAGTWYVYALGTQRRAQNKSTAGNGGPGLAKR
jgi:hypothetical protein